MFNEFLLKKNVNNFKNLKLNMGETKELIKIIENSDTTEKFFKLKELSIQQYLLGNRKISFKMYRYAWKNLWNEEWDSYEEIYLENFEINPHKGYLTDDEVKKALDNHCV